MQTLSQQKPDFKLVGIWTNKTTKKRNDPPGLVRMTFLNDTIVLIKFNPGSEFQYDYHIDSKPEFYALHLKRRTNESSFFIFLFKIIDADTLKVQFLDHNDPLEWTEKDKSLNTGVLRRLSGK